MSKCLSVTVFLAAAISGYAGEVRLVVVDPGHFHAALVQKDQYPRVSPHVSVYSPLTSDLLEYLNRITLFNSRKEAPTQWNLTIATGADFFERMLSEHPGNVAVFSGRNRNKIDRILRSLEVGYNVLADKPWIINSADMPKLVRALDIAQQRGLVAFDIMTERYEITSILQAELVQSPDVFGSLVKGSAAEPAINARSIHYLSKLVSGVPLRRPTWFLNMDEAGEGMADVGTHVVDLVQWVAFRPRLFDYRRDVRILKARRWPTVISKSQFAQVTGVPEYPQELQRWVKDDSFEYYANHTVSYTVGGVHIFLDLRWGWEAQAGSGDIYEAAFRGTRSRVEIRQGKEQNFLTELYVVPNSATVRDEVFAGLRKEIALLQAEWPGVELEVRNAEARIVIPDKYRVGHEDHFAQVTREFLKHLDNPAALSAWEKSNMLLKYYITTGGVELSRRGA